MSVIEHHALFQLKDGVAEAAKTAKDHFDAYDHANQKDARKFLLNSVDEHLEKQLYENCNSDDTFVAYLSNRTWEWPEETSSTLQSKRAKPS